MTLAPTPVDSLFAGRSVGARAHFNPAKEIMQAIEQTLDLDQFEDVLIATVAIKNPVTGAPTAATVDVAGPEHPARKKIGLDRARRMRAQFQKTGKIEVSDPLDDIEDETDLLVAIVTGWSNMVFGGVALEYSPEAARKLFTDPKRQWLRAQVKKAIDETDRFIGNSAKA